MATAQIADLPVPNPVVAADFLGATLAKDIHLVSIKPDPAEGEQPHGRWFGDDAGGAGAWAISENRAGKNVYWTVNVTREGLHKKPVKGDIRAARFLHVDVDPPKDGGAFDRAAILSMLGDARHPPSLVIDSGNGLQAFWRLDYPAENRDAVEDLNRRLARLYGGDSCHNIDRLMRVPGTVNYPGAVKRKRGRIPALTSIAEPDTGLSVDPVEIDADAPPLPPEEKAERRERERVHLVDVDLATLASLGITGLNKLGGMISAPDNSDRSAATFAVACEMVRQGFDDAQIAGILLNPNLPISSHCLDQLSPKRAAARAISGARGAVKSDPGFTGEGERPPDNGDAEASEDTIALAFTAQHGGTLRFDHDCGRWYRWDGARWVKDCTDLAFDFARRLARTVGESKRSLCKASVAHGAERFARADRTHAITSDQWDADPMLLGTPSGTIDLATGDLFDPDPAHLITKQTGCAPEHGEPTLWLRFLGEAMAGDMEMVRFLQQWSGYCLTGKTNEHALLFAYGPGGNGKSVFLNTLTAIMGDYAVTSAMDTFTASRNDRHSTELAMLRGARLVTASETEEGRAWAEARIKALTGGDPITARFMRQDNFTFRPQFKLTIAGNHAPSLRNVDDAMRRRFNIVPFTHRPKEPDRQLEEKLVAEHGRILAWAIAGCRDWQANGLVRPAAVAAATAEYFEEQDMFGQWLGERCELIEPGNPSLFATSAELFTDWERFAKEHGEFAGSAKSFGAAMKRRGYSSKNMRAGGQAQKCYQGVRLIPRAGGYDAD